MAKHNAELDRLEAAYQVAVEKFLMAGAEARRRRMTKKGSYSAAMAKKQQLRKPVKDRARELSWHLWRRYRALARAYRSASAETLRSK